MGESCEPVQSGGDSGDSGEESSGWWNTIDGISGLSDFVGGLIGSTLDLLVSPLTILGDSVIALGNALGFGFDESTQNQDEIKGEVKGGFTQIFGDIGKILSYLNPLSENFFLKIAVVPADGTFEEFNSKISTMLKNKFGVVYQIKDTMDAFLLAVQSNASGGFQGLKVDLSRYGAGQLEIIDGHAMLEYGSKLKFWIGGLMWFLTGAFVIRKFSGLISEGK